MKTRARRDRSTVLSTIQFTTAEVRRIKKAAKICGWSADEGPIFGRQLLLRGVDEILRGARRSRKTPKK